MAKKGEKISEEHRQKIIAFNKSRVWTKEQRLARAQLARDTHTGMKRSDETKRKMSLKQLGIRKKPLSEHVTPLHTAIRKSFKYRQWRSDVYQRDNYTCQFCGVIGGVVLNADHIKPFYNILKENKIGSLDEADMCEELWNINNGRTLCLDCHKTTESYCRRIE